MFKLYPYLSERASTIAEWSSTDNYQTYKPTTRFGKNVYKPGEFYYRYNNFGFRCDDFSLKSEIPIVFLGCSTTEGIGLPQEEVWAYKLLEKIRKATGKTIPYWNLALSGTGIDTSANVLHDFSKLNDIKFIFSRFTSFYRREYCFDSDYAHQWIGNEIKTENKFSHLFSDSKFKEYQSIRSLQIIDLIRHAKNATSVCMTWSTDPEDENILSSFSDLNYRPCNKQHVDLARDGMHAGPVTNSIIANKFWSEIYHYF